MKFIILLERWPYATSLMIEVITRLNYERDARNNGLSLDERRLVKRNHNFDKKELSGRIFNYFGGLKDYNSLELYCLYDALEQELLRHNAGALRLIYLKDVCSIRTTKRC